MKKIIYGFSFVALIICSTLLFAIDEYEYQSELGQDKWVNENIFHNKRNGVFVDIGAYDGVRFSNTLFFEKCLGWTGLCVEPLAHVFEKLQENRSCICFNGCIADCKGEANFLRVGYYEMMSGLLDKYDPRSLARINSEFEVYGGERQIITVQCYLLKDLLDEYSIDHVDYLSVDTEGSELNVLKSIDFGKVSIDVIDVENNYSDPSIRDFLEQKGYQFVTKIERSHLPSGTPKDEIYQKIK